MFRENLAVPLLLWDIESQEIFMVLTEIN